MIRSFRLAVFGGRSPLALGKRVRGLFLLLFLVVPAQAMPLGFESGPHFFRAYPPALSAFVQLTNASLAYGNGLTGGAIPPIPLIGGGLGIRAAATLGEPFALGLGFSVFQAGTGTEGKWGEIPVSVRLGLSYADLHGALLFSPWPGLLWLSLFAGVGTAAVGYAVDFPTWPLPFVPAVGEKDFRGRAFVAGFWARAAFPILPVLTLGLEAGYRWALFPGLLDGTLPMDLDRNGSPDVLDLSGLWFGLTLRVEFPL